MESTAESRWYEVPPELIGYNPVLPEMRTGIGQIWRVGPTLKKIKWDILAIVGALLAVANWNLLMLLALSATVARDVRAIAAVIRQAGERLEDPKELLVFEVVTLLQARKSRLVNHSALAAGDYDAAYGRLAPTTDDIADEIAHYPLPQPVPEEWRQHPPAIWRDDLQTTLDNLKAREILHQRNGRWSVVF